jgi:hypothetical protein
MPRRPTIRRRAAVLGMVAALALVTAACSAPSEARPTVGDEAGTVPVVTTTPTTAATTTVAPTTSTTTTTLPVVITDTAAAEDPAAPVRTTCSSVVHIGDSTSVGMIDKAIQPDPAKRVDAQYQRVGVTDVRIEISGARSIVERMPNQQNAAERAQAQKADGYEGCWVLALGTTDTANVAVGSNVDRISRIDKMMGIVGDDPVLWVGVKTLKEKGAWSNANMQVWNDQVRSALARYPNLRFYDWAAVVQDGWFSPDRTHYTSAGYAERARLIADALAVAFPA